MGQSKLNNLINPQVMGKMVSGALPKKIKFTKIAKLDSTLVGNAGNTITVPKFAYIGDAENVAEGVAMGTTVLTATSTQVTVQKAGKALELTDEALLSAYGDPVGEASKQLTMAIASKIDNDCLDALYTASLIYEETDRKAIGYEQIVKAVDLFEEESDLNSKKVIFVHPKQITQIRLDPEFRDINKYPLATVMTGTIGEVAGCMVIPSRKVKYDSSGGFYKNPIVITNMGTEDAGATGSAEALTIYLKREVQLESDRDILAKTTVVSADEHYAVSLSNDAKVVIAHLKA